MIISKKNRLIIKCSFIALVLSYCMVQSFFISAPKAHAVLEFEPVYEVLKNTSGETTGAQVKHIWEILINTVNYFIIAILIFVAFAQILRINVSTYGIKKILPALILAIIGANFSFLFCRLMVDLANVLIAFFVHRPDSDVLATNFQGTWSEPSSWTPALKDSDVGRILWFMVTQLFVIAGGIIVLILSYLFFIRIWLIYFLVALAPLAFLATALPQTKTVFTQWMSNFAKWVFLPVVSIFWIWLGNQWMSVAKGDFVMTYVFAGVCYYLAITTPFKMGGAVMVAWGNLGKKLALNNPISRGVGAAGGAAWNAYKEGWSNKWTGRFLRAKTWGKRKFGWGQGLENTRSQLAFEQYRHDKYVERQRGNWSKKKGEERVMERREADMWANEELELEQYARVGLLERGMKARMNRKKYEEDHPEASKEELDRMAPLDKNFERYTEYAATGAKAKVRKADSDSLEGAVSEMFGEQYMNPDMKQWYKDSHLTDEEVGDDEELAKKRAFGKRKLAEQLRMFGYKGSDAEMWQQYSEHMNMRSFTAIRTDQNKAMYEKRLGDSLKNPLVERSDASTVADTKAVKRLTESIVRMNKFMQQFGTQEQAILEAMAEAARTGNKTAEQVLSEHNIATDQHEGYHDNFKKMAAINREQESAALRTSEIAVRFNWIDRSELDAARTAATANGENFDVTAFIKAKLEGPEGIAAQQQKFVEDKVKALNKTFESGVPVWMHDLVKIEKDANGKEVITDLVEMDRLERNRTQKWVDEAVEKSSSGWAQEYNIHELGAMALTGSTNENFSTEDMGNLLNGEICKNTKSERKAVQTFRAIEKGLKDFKDSPAAVSYILQIYAKYKPAELDRVWAEIMKIPSFEDNKRIAEIITDKEARGLTGAELVQPLSNIYNAISNRGQQTLFTGKLIETLPRMAEWMR